MLCSANMSELLSSLLVFVLIILSAGVSEGDEGKQNRRDLSHISDLASSWSGIETTVWATKGSSVVLECSFVKLLQSKSTLQHYTVKWYRNNQEISNKRMVQTRSGHLNITKVRRRGRSERDDGEYHCAVAFDTQKHVVLAAPSVELRVAEISRNIRLSSSNTSVHEGDVLRLKCQIASQPPAKITWQREPTALPQDSRATLLSPGVLQITDVQKSDAGVYKCIAKNEVLNKTKTHDGIKVAVLPPATMIVSPKFLSPQPVDTIRVPLNGNVTLECLVTSFPKSKVEWLKKVSQDKFIVLEEVPNKVELIGQANLRLTSVDREDSGIYRCQASFASSDGSRNFSNTQETHLEVVLSPPPVSVRPINNMTTLVGQTSRLNCSREAHNFPASSRIQWYKDGRLLEEDSRLKLNGPTQVIIINSLTRHTGVFQCSARNEAGFSTSWTYLLVNSSASRPRAPSNIRFSVDSPTSVQMYWDPVTSLDPVKAYTIHYTEQGSSGAPNEEKSVVATNNSYHLDRLKPNTKYSVEIRAYSTDSPSELSERKFFTTFEDVPPVIPDFKFEALSPTTMLVSWSPLTPRQALGEVVGYKILWRRRNKIDSYSVETVGVKTLSYVLKSLHPGKIYKVLVIAGTSAGYPRNDSWAWRSITMPELVPMPPQMTLQSVSDEKDRKKTSIKVLWVQPDKSVSPLDGYIIQFRQSGKDWSRELQLDPEARSHVIRNLVPAKYEVRMRSFNQEGESAASLKLINTENESGTEYMRISNLEVLVDTGTIVHLSWSVDRSLEDTVKYYLIKISNIENVDDPNVLEDDFYMKSTRPSTTVDTLNPANNYEFSVRAHVSDSLFGPYNQPVPLRKVLISSSPQPPIIPEVQESEPLDPSTIRLAWSFHGARPSKFVVAYSDNSSIPQEEWKTKDFPGTINDGKIGGLVSNKLYWFKISACSDISCGEYSRHLTERIPAVLSDNSLLYGIAGLIAVLVVLMCAAGFIFYFVKYQSSAPARPANCNGNGMIASNQKHINAKMSANHLSSCENGETNGLDGDYIPMLNRFHTTGETQLDTKGGYPSKVNFTNPRLNGLIKPKDHFTSAFSSKRVDDVEECEGLFESGNRNAPMEVNACNRVESSKVTTKPSSYKAISSNVSYLNQCDRSGSTQFDTSYHKSDQWSCCSKNPPLQSSSTSQISESFSIAP